MSCFRNVDWTLYKGSSERSRYHRSGTFICRSLEDDHGKSILRLSMGRMLDQLLANMETAIAGHSGHSSSFSSSSSGSNAVPSPPPKMMMYSGDDSTIMPLMTALGVDVDMGPPYLSNLGFELGDETTTITS